MPIVVKQSINAESRIAMHMLNIEMAAKAFSCDEGDLKLLPEPHAEWPLLEIPPITTSGVPYHIHYKAACGIIYAAGSTDEIKAFADRLANMLEPMIAHFDKARAVISTPTSYVRIEGYKTGRTMVTGPRTPYEKPMPTVLGMHTMPARLIIYTPSNYQESPPIYSCRAIFTWIIAPLSLLLSQSIKSASGMTTNSLLASILYDKEDRFKFAEDQEIQRVKSSDMRTVTSAIDPEWMPSERLMLEMNRENRIIPLPEALKPLGDFYGLIVTKLPAKKDAGKIAEDQTHQILLVGNYHTLRPSASMANTARYLATIPKLEFAAARIGVHAPIAGCEAGKSASRCAICRVPLGGQAYLISNPLSSGEFRGDINAHDSFVGGASFREKLTGIIDLEKGDPLMSSDPGAPKSALACRFCMHAVSSPVAAFAEMKASVFNVIIPWSQSTAAEACGLPTIARLLNGHVSATNVKGAYLVKIAADVGAADAANPFRIVLAGRSLGSWPELTSGLSVPDSTIIPGINIVESE